MGAHLALHPALAAGVYVAESPGRRGSLRRDTAGDAPHGAGQAPGERGGRGAHAAGIFYCFKWI